MKPLEIDFNKLTRDIDSAAADWDASGAVAVIYDGKLKHCRTYGWADRENNIRASEGNTHLISARCPVMLGIAIMLLVENGRLNLSDTLDRFIPEYLHGSRVTIRHLLHGNSGIPDYFYVGIMVDLSDSGNHRELSYEQRHRIERNLREAPVKPESLLQVINDKPLEFEPGSRRFAKSTSSELLLEIIIESVTGQTLAAFLTGAVFQPLGMKQTIPGWQTDTVSYSCINATNRVRLPVDSEIDHSLVTTIEDMIIFMQALAGKKVLRKKSWQALFAINRRNRSIIAESVNGFACCESHVLGYEFNLYMDQDKRLTFIHLTNEIQTMKVIAGEECYFRKSLRRVIEEAVTFPCNTHLRPFGDHNMLDAMYMDIHDHQRFFVWDPRSALSFVLAKPKTRKPLILMEGRRSIGLLVLTIDRKKAIYEVSELLIDKKYQQRGFGKIMLRKGLDVLKRAGAKQIEIGVSRFNIPAQMLYFGLGFEKYSVYDQHMALRINL